MTSRVWIIYGEPLLAIVAAAIVVSALAAVHRIAPSGRNDFSVFIESARWLREGADPYQRPTDAGPGTNLNAPASLLLFLPLSFLPTAFAFQLWTMTSIAAFVLAARWIARAVAPGRSLTVASAVLISQPAIVSLLLGQTTAVMMLLVTAAWIADRESRPWQAGLLAGTAVALKPFLAVLAIYVLWRRSRSMLIGLCAGVAATGVAGLAAVGVSGYRAWLAALGQISWIAHVLNASMLGLVTRALDRTPDVLHTAPIVLKPQLVQPLWWAAVIVIVVFGTRAVVASRDPDRTWAVMLLGSLLVSPLGWIYYAPLAAGPLLGVSVRSTRSTSAVFAAGYACLLVPPVLRAAPRAADSTLVASIYTGGLLLLFAGACAFFTQRGTQNCSIREQAPLGI